MQTSLKEKALRFLQSTEGPTTVEYAFFMALIVIACMVCIAALGDGTSSVFENTAGQLEAETAKSQ